MLDIGLASRSPLRSPPTVLSDPPENTNNHILNNNPDRPSNVSILAGKYILFDNNGPNNSTNTNKSSCVLKCYQRCIKIDTKEQFSCKVVSRNQEGLQLVVGYHRLDEGCDAISKVHEVVLSPKSLYMIMPASYGNVHAYLLAKKKLKEPEAANIFRQMVTAVQFCHSKGIVLRDLKMGKFVFHDKERTIVRLDTLEDAVLLNDLNDDGLSDKHGCPNYVSPEKAEILRSNKKYPGKATDMWGLGVILYTLLVGRYPFNDEDHSKLFVKIRRGHYSIPENLSGSAKVLIRCLLQKDPSARPSCGEILKHSWLNSGTLQGAGSNLSSASRTVISTSVSGLRVNSNNSGSTASAARSLPAGVTTLSSPVENLNNASSNENNTLMNSSPPAFMNSIVPSSASSGSRAINLVSSQSQFSSSSNGYNSNLSDPVMSEFQPIYDMLGNNSKQCYPKPNDSEDQVVPNIDI